MADLKKNTKEKKVKENKEEPKDKLFGKVSYVGAGIALGAVFGFLFDNIAIGVGLGVAIGVTIDAVKNKNY